VAYSALYRPGPMKCLPDDTVIRTKDCNKKIKDLINFYDEIPYYNKNKELKYTKRFGLWKTGKKKIMKITTKSGKEIRCSVDHKFFKPEGKCLEAKNLHIGDKIAISQTI
jgi:intein/homing endonuclease